MTELSSPRTSPCWWLVTHGATTARVRARLATEAHAAAGTMLGNPHFSEVVCVEDPDQGDHVTENDQEQSPTEPPPPSQEKKPRITTDNQNAIESMQLFLAASEKLVAFVADHEQLLSAYRVLLEDNMRLRGIISKDGERETDEIAVGYEPTEEVDEP